MPRENLTIQFVRRRTMLTLIAIDLGATNIRAALVAEDGRIVAHAGARTPTAGPSAAVVTERIIGLAEELLATPEGRAAEIAAVGIASVGPLDLARGRVVHSPNVAFPAIDLVGPIRERFDLPVALINDCRAGVLGERWAGAARGADNVVYITMSTGIGGGAVVNGRLLLGRNGNAGEIGHLIVDDRYSLRCGCGNLGHWEAYASGRYIPRFFRVWCEAEGLGPVSFDAGSAKGIFAAARKGDAVALAFMEALGRVNGAGVSNVIVAYNPEIIVMAGPIAEYHGDIVIGHLMPHVDRFLALPRIVTSELAGRAPLLGAAAYALEQI